MQKPIAREENELLQCQGQPFAAVRGDVEPFQRPTESLRILQLGFDGRSAANRDRMENREALMAKQQASCWHNGPEPSRQQSVFNHQSTH